MSETGTLVTIGILCFLAGMLAGALVYRMTQAETSKNRRLSQQLDQLKEEHSRYQAEVGEHFGKTAELFSKLNSNYREVLSHLSRSAEKLSDDASFRRTMNLSAPQGRRPLAEEDQDSLQPPRDYAPKAGPAEKGTLAEDYGLDPYTKL